MLVKERFLSREKGSGSRKAVEDHLREQGVSFTRTMDLGSRETIKQGVMAGLGVSILSRFSMALELATGCLVSLDVESFPIVRTWCIVHPQEKRLSPAAQAFIDYILSHEEQLKQTINNRFMGAVLPE
jgi:DNA-binding transcriptional LysR family regulator